MNADAFLHKMKRFEEDVQEHPDMLREFAVQEKLLHNLQALEREIALLAAALRGNRR